MTINAKILLDAMRESCSLYDAFVSLDNISSDAAVSVIIGAYERPVTLPMILDALSRQKGVKLQVIVVDAGSSPPLLLQIPTTAQDLHAYLYRPSDGLYHRVRSFNEGAALASHDILILLDDDVVPANDFWALSAVRAFTDNPSASVAQLPMIIMKFGANLEDAVDRKSEVLALHSKWPDSFHDWTTCNIAVRKDAWRDLAGFNASLDGRYGGEDVDFNARVRNAGLQKVKALPYGCALHVGVWFAQRGLPVGKVFNR